MKSDMKFFLLVFLLSIANIIFSMDDFTVLQNLMNISNQQSQEATNKKKQEEKDDEEREREDYYRRKRIEEENKKTKNKK